MWILKFFFTRNRVFKPKGVVSNLHVCCNGLGKMWASYIFHLFTKNSNLHTYEKNYYFFASYMSRFPIFTFLFSIMSKWLAKHICTKVSFKITIRKGHVYIDNRWPWKWNLYFYLGIWNDERTKIIIFPSFQFVTGFNLENRNETSLLMNSDTLICLGILVIPIGIIRVSTSRKWSILLYYSSLHDYWPPTTLISLVHNSMGEM